MNRDQIEAQRPKHGPAVTHEHVASLILGADYHIFPGTTVTVCLLRLANGYTATGESACVDPANFDVALGKKIAYSRALDKIFQLEGYLLKQAMYEDATAAKHWSNTDD